MKLVENIIRITPKILSKLVSRIISDKTYLRIVYRRKMGKKLNLKNPVTFQEKLQWLKIYNRMDIYTKMVDKYEAKSYVADIIGEEYVIPTFGVWDKASEIDFDKLPNQFVLKTTHDSGGVFVCKDKSLLEIDKIVTFLEKRLNIDIFYSNREWPYKNVVHRIIAEKYIVDESGYELKDYKFFTFNGIIKFIKVDFDRYTNHHANYYDIDWNLLKFEEIKCPSDFERHCQCPDNFDGMLEIVRKLSENIPFLRVDLYNVNGKIFFGELTFFPDSGLGAFHPSKWNKIMGDLIRLPS